MHSKLENIDNNDRLCLSGMEFKSRLLVGTGRYKNFSLAQEAIVASGAEIVTVAVRRIDLKADNGASLTDYITQENYVYLPNSAGCYSALEAVRTLRLAYANKAPGLVKLEVIGDEASLYPNMPETIKAAEILVKEGFKVMVYCVDDPSYTKILQDTGCTAIMPLAAPIGSGLGIQNPDNIKKIIEIATVPVIVDAGIGTASDATIAMELGCDGVLMNAAISDATNPVLMAKAMRLAVESGRLAYLAGRMPKRQTASASSSMQGKI